MDIFRHLAIEKAIESDAYLERQLFGYLEFHFRFRGGNPDETDQRLG